jgi:DNA-binding FrmR family transcriptional regulator
MFDDSTDHAEAPTSPADAVEALHRSMMTEGPIPEDVRRNLHARLARIEGQVRGIDRMIEMNRRCPEVLVQVGAVQKALDGVARLLTRNYLERCATHAIHTGDTAVYDELMDVIYRYR